MCIINTVYIIPDTRYYIYFEYRSVREKRNLYINFEIRIHTDGIRFFSFKMIERIVHQSHLTFLSSRNNCQFIFYCVLK